MAYGDSPHDQTLKRAWEEFCDRLKEAGELVFRDPAPSTPLDRAAGFEYLSRQIGRGLDVALEHNDPLHPDLRWNQQPIRKYGGDNPDAVNLRARIDGQHTYRLVGDRGTAPWVVFSLHKPHPTVPWQWQEVGQLLGDDLRTECDGSFQLVLSPHAQPGNWLKTTPDTHQISIRQHFGDWHLERPMTVRIECEGVDGPPLPLTPERVAEGLRGAADVVASNTIFWADWLTPHIRQPNRFADTSRQGKDLGGTPAGISRSVYWKVRPHEALLIEVTPPHCRYWNMELNNYWMCSIDYRHRLSSINKAQVVREHDGSVIVAVAHQDPGIPNWLDTGGHCEGRVGLRWIKTDSSPLPRSRLVSLDDLPKVLPPDVRRISPTERREQLRLRGIGVDRRFRV